MTEEEWKALKYGDVIEWSFGGYRYMFIGFRRDPMHPMGIAIEPSNPRYKRDTPSDGNINPQYKSWTKIE